LTAILGVERALWRVHKPFTSLSLIVVDEKLGLKHVMTIGNPR